MAVIPGGVENGATGEGATWTGRPKAERAGASESKLSILLKKPGMPRLRST
jgi:hypothetical protein